MATEPSDPATGAHDRDLRALERRVRDHKRAVERLNPLEDPARYHDAFDRLVELEAELRRARRGSPGGEQSTRGGSAAPSVPPTSAGPAG